MVYEVKTFHSRFMPAGIQLLATRRISRKVRFDFSCQYDLGPDEYQLDINKLYGIGFIPGHHTHSARFGWRYNKEKRVIELFGYVYDGKVRKSNYLGDCQMGKFYYLDLVIEESGYSFLMNNHAGFSRSIAMPIEHGRIVLVGYYLHPYFGGNLPAPHKMIIEIEKI